MSLQFDPECIHAIAPYVVGKSVSEVARGFGLNATRIVKPASNENPLGMPQSAKNAVAAAIDELTRYPDANGFNPEAVLHAEFGVPKTWITLGNGSGDILELATHALVSPGQAVIYAQHSFAVYALAAQEVDAHAIEVPTRDYGHDPDTMTATVTPDTRLIYIINPDNPTGTLLPTDAIAIFLARMPPTVVVVLDEAYDEFLEPEQQYDSTAWVRQYPSSLMSRTFSRAYGLADLRVSYGIAQPQLTDLLNRIRQPFSVNNLAQAATAAMLNDAEFLRRSAQLNAAGYVQLTDAFDRLDLEHVPSSDSFVLVHVNGDNDAGARVNIALLKQGVIVRPVGNYGLPQWLRVSIGSPEKNATFIAALEAALAQEKMAA